MRFVGCFGGHMLKTLASLAAATCLVACAAPQKPIVWYKDGATEAEFSQAKYQCDYETTAATQNTDYSYRSIIGQEMDRAMRKGDLFKRCMMAKGYRAG